MNRQGSGPYAQQQRRRDQDKHPTPFHKDLGPGDQIFAHIGLRRDVRPFTGRTLALLTRKTRLGSVMRYSRIETLRSALHQPL